MSFFKQMFATKSLEMLAAEAEGDNRLRRILGPIGLTSLGIGAIIGAGIFVMTGRAAAQDAGPAIVLSYMVAGLGCLFAALCYSEFAAMAPVAGSAYTYAYATLGELMAWIIGWDLVLEYAMACACVASAWSKYLNEFLYNSVGWKIPEYLCSDPFSKPDAWFNLPALVIVLLVTGILVIGIRESATTNAVLVAVKVGVVLFVIGAGIAFVNPSNWTSIPPAERIRAEDTIVPDLSRKEVAEGSKLPAHTAEERLKGIEKTVESLYDDREKLTPGEAKNRIEAVKRQVRWLYQQTAKLPEYEAQARVRRLTNQIEAKMKLDRRKEELLPQVQAGQLSQEDADKAVAALSAKLLDEFNVRDSKAIKETIEKLQGQRELLALQSKTDEVAEIDATLVQAKKELEAVQARKTLELPATEEEKELVARLIKDVRKEADKKVTDKWGLLGKIGLNKQLSAIDDSVRGPFMPYGLGGIIFGASIVFFAYIGFDSISTHSEEAKKPQRDVPIAILLSLVVCTLLYIGVASVITGMVPYPEIDTKAAVAAAFRQKAESGNVPWLKGAAVLIATGALAGMTSVLLITFLSQARVFLAMARDRLLPPAIFGAIHPRFRTPHISTMLTGGIIAVVSAFTPIEKLEEMVNIGTLMAFVIVCAAVLILRIQRPNAHRPFRAPLLWFVAPAGILVNFVMMLFLPVDTWLRLLIWLGLGLLIYFFYGMKQSALGQELRGLTPSFAGHGTLPDDERSPRSADTDAIKPHDPRVKD